MATKLKRFSKGELAAYCAARPPSRPREDDEPHIVIPDLTPYVRKATKMWTRMCGAWREHPTAFWQPRIWRLHAQVNRKLGAGLCVSIDFPYEMVSAQAHFGVYRTEPVMVREHPSAAQVEKRKLIYPPLMEWDIRALEL